MANVPASGVSARSQTSTLTANSVEVYTLDRGYPYVEVLVISSPDTNGVSYTMDRGDNDQTQTTPTYRGAGTYYVAPNAARREQDDIYGNAVRLGAPPANVVRVISPSACVVAVTGFDTP